MTKDPQELRARIMKALDPRADTEDSYYDEPMHHAIDKMVPFVHSEVRKALVEMKAEHDKWDTSDYGRYGSAGAGMVKNAVGNWLANKIEELSNHPTSKGGSVSSAPDVARIYLMCARKQWWHNLPDDWKEVAWERFSLVECGIYEKPTSQLTKEDKEWVESYSEPPEGWIDPTPEKDKTPTSRNPRKEEG